MDACQSEGWLRQDEGSQYTFNELKPALCPPCSLPLVTHRDYSSGLRTTPLPLSPITGLHQMDTLSAQRLDSELLMNTKPLETKCKTLLVWLIPGVAPDTQCCRHHALDCAEWMGVFLWSERKDAREKKKILQLQMIKDKEEDPRYTKAMAVQSSTVLVL